MDMTSILIFIVGIALYFCWKPKPVLLFISGWGLGILIGLLWAQMLINQALCLVK